ncbi:MAG: PilN domain-containing protein [Firmicutes bacterium]|nr:PilN domain-containing protein [Bacillota bacterium]
MKDLNFFEPYVRKNNKDYKEIALYTTLGIIVGLIILFPIINAIRLNNMNKEITVLKTELNSPKLQSKINTLETRKKEIKDLKNHLKDLKIIDDKLSKLNVINDTLLNKITMLTPKNINFKALNINKESITIQGITDNQNSIGAFQFNLRNNKSFEKVYVASINKESNNFNFNITFNIKGVKENESN